MLLQMASYAVRSRHSTHSAYWLACPSGGSTPRTEARAQGHRQNPAAQAHVNEEDNDDSEDDDYAERDDEEDNEDEDKSNDSHCQQELVDELTGTEHAARTQHEGQVRSGTPRKKQRTMSKWQQLPQRELAGNRNDTGLGERMEKLESRMSQMENKIDELARIIWNWRQQSNTAHGSGGATVAPSTTNMPVGSPTKKAMRRTVWYLMARWGRALGGTEASLIEHGVEA